MKATGPRAEAIEQRMRQAREVRREIEACYQQNGLPTPAEATSRDARDALTAIELAWPSQKASIVEAVAASTDWITLAQKSLDWRPTPITDQTPVWVSRKGDVYHWVPVCEGLREGQRIAKEADRYVHGTEKLRLGEAKRREGFSGKMLRPCKVCS